MVNKTKSKKPDSKKKIDKAQWGVILALIGVIFTLICYLNAQYATKTELQKTEEYLYSLLGMLQTRLESKIKNDDLKEILERILDLQERYRGNTQDKSLLKELKNLKLLERTYENEINRLRHRSKNNEIETVKYMQ